MHRGLDSLWCCKFGLAGSFLLIAFGSSFNVHGFSLPGTPLSHIRTQTRLLPCHETILKMVEEELSAPKKKGFFANFFEELDNFVDDATSRRLGNGAAFYGKRKSSFYGASDKGKKQDAKTPDPLEDYQGPSSSGYFKWIPDEETGQFKPVSKMREKNLERNPSFWDKVYSKEDDQE